MELQESKKLKRGLKELSPLFGTVPQMIIPQSRLRPETEILTVSVFHPDFPDDSLLSSSSFAGQVNVAGYPAALVLLRSGSSNGFEASKNIGLCGHRFSLHPDNELPVFSVRQHYLHWTQLDYLSSQSGAELGGKELHPQVLFMDFDYRYMTYFKRVIPILDKWVLHLRPQTESLNEAYKMLKVSARLNPHLEYYLLFDGSGKDARGDLLYERFSEMVSRRLGLTIGWLGNFHMGKSGGAGGVNLSLENFFMKSVARVDALEKIALANYLQYPPNTPVRMAV
jgi:hypothetical protein